MLFPERNVASEALSARVIAGGEGGAPRLRGEGEVGPGICDRQIWFGRSTTSPSHCFAMGPTLSPATRRRGTLRGEGATSAGRRRKNPAAQDRAPHADVLELVRRHRQRIVVEDGEVGALADIDAAQLLVELQRVGGP